MLKLGSNPTQSQKVAELFHFMIEEDFMPSELPSLMIKYTDKSCPEIKSRVIQACEAILACCNEENEKKVEKNTR